MYIIPYKKKVTSGVHDRYEYHKKYVPWIYVALWIAGLMLSILNPILPCLDLQTPNALLLNSLLYIYGIFVIEVFVTFTDIHNIYKDYSAKKLLRKITLRTILPNMVLTILSFLWYYSHQEMFWLLPFVLLSAYMKYLEVWLANNGDDIFTKQEKRDKESNKLKPQPLS